jgi:hypothetical protein
MESAGRIRWSGLGLILGGGYMVIWGFTHIIPAILLIVGLLGLYDAEKSRTGALASVGVYITCLGCVVGGIVELLNLAGSSGLGSAFVLIATSIFTIGLLLFSIGTIRARVFSDLACYVCIVGIILIPIAGWGAPLIAGGLIIMGIQLLLNKYNLTDSG